MKRALLPLLLSIGGCMPHVMHSARVEPGTTASIAGSLGRNAGTGEHNSTYVPSLYVGARRGWVAADDGEAALIGVQASPLLLLFAADSEQTDDFAEVAFAVSYLDLYAQPRGFRTATWDAGVGALASSAVIAPYVQYGRKVSDVTGWFTTQMIIFAAEPLNADTYWLPSIGWHDRGRTSATSGINIDLAAAVPISGQDREWFFTLTFTAELGLTPREAKQD